MYYAALKSYLTVRKDGSRGAVMFKGVVDKDSLGEQSFRDMVHGKKSMSETRKEIRRDPLHGVSVVDRTLAVSSFRNAVNYKFRLLENGDVRSFD